MTERLTAMELAAMEARFKAMGGQSAKKLTYGDMVIMERKFRQMERESALRKFRSKQAQ